MFTKLIQQQQKTEIMKDLSIDSILSYTIDAFASGTPHQLILDTLSSYVQEFKEKVDEEERIRKEEAYRWEGLRFYKNTTHHIECFEDLEIAFANEISHYRSDWNDDEINVIVESGIDLSFLLK